MSFIASLRPIVVNRNFSRFSKQVLVTPRCTFLINNKKEMSQTREDDAKSITMKKLTPEYLDEALQTLSVGFFPYESISLGCSVNSNAKACRELEKLAALTAEDKASFVAIDSSTNKVIGALFNKIQKKCDTDAPSFFEHFRDDHCQESNSKALIDFMIEMDSFIDIFSKFQVDQVLELMFIAVNPEYRRRGIATSLIDFSLDVIKKENSAIKLASSLATSSFTYKILKKLHFEEVLKKELNDFSFNNEPYSSKVDCSVHNTGLVLFVKKIQ
ncbi:uncharacterized protein LOC120350566 [Nilaparvata lugens]|uniref:uncharacterized protein LOC120350566 n=1 Tax=Nilaparvata lugens TaxID=108931 RepID=UPI00193E2519|nr:uncharacterized protein LOC120350566 [Nilaparvata lugens]